MHQQKAFLTIWNTLIMFPVLLEMEMKPKLMIWWKPLSVWHAESGVQNLFQSLHCLCFKFLWESVHACGIHTCLCGTAVWPASDSFSILSASRGGVCVGVITDYAVSFLPLGELHILWSQRASEDLHHEPFEPRLRWVCRHTCALCKLTHSTPQALWVLLEHVCAALYL